MDKRDMFVILKIKKENVTVIVVVVFVNQEKGVRVTKIFPRLCVPLYVIDRQQQRAAAPPKFWQQYVVAFSRVDKNGNDCFRNSC